MASSKESTLLFYEPNESGHRFYFVRECVEASVSSCVLLTSKESLRSREFDQQLKGLVETGRLRVVALGGKKSVREAVLLCREFTRPWLIDLDADRRLHLWMVCGWRMRRRLILLVMRPPEPPFGHPFVAVKGFVKWVLMFAAKSSSRLCVLSELRTDSRPTMWRRAFNEAPDPFPKIEGSLNRNDCRRDLGIAQDQFILSILGVVSHRKNPDIAIGAVKTLRKMGVDAGLLIMGKLEDSSGQVLKDAACEPNLVYVRDEYVDERVLRMGVMSSNCILLLHSNDGTSGILRHAYVSGVPVLAAGSPKLMREVKALEAGRVCGLSLTGVVEELLEMVREDTLVSGGVKTATGADFARALFGSAAH